jgi:putative transcriptional regulator
MSGGTIGTTIRHHPSEAMLVAQAAGSLWEAAALIVEAHLDQCAHCSATLRLAEAVGGALLDGLSPMPLAPDALRRAMDRLDEVDSGVPEGSNFSSAQQAPAAPRQEHSLVRQKAHNTRLHWLAPGIGHAVLLNRPGNGTLRVLRVKPGTALPRHSHRGSELTLVLEGAFVDETGHYGPGDLAEVDETISHRPVAEGPTDCVCLIATQGRLRFNGLLTRLFGAIARV